MSFLNKIRNWTIRDTEERGNSQEWFDLFFQRDEKQKEMISPLPKGQTITDNSEYGVQESDKFSGFADFEGGVKDIYKQQLGTAVRDTTDLNEYYPIMDELVNIYDKGSSREGLPELLSLQALFESTGGKASNNNNLFGALPEGEGGEPASFDSLSDSIDYQLSENVLGGGVDNKLNILEGEGPITEKDIIELYDSYNPKGDYLDSLIYYYNILQQ